MFFKNQLKNIFIKEIKKEKDKLFVSTEINKDNEKKVKYKYIDQYNGN